MLISRGGVSNVEIPLSDLQSRKANQTIQESITLYDFNWIYLPVYIFESDKHIIHPMNYEIEIYKYNE